MPTHPDLGDPEAAIMHDHQMRHAEHMDRMREAERQRKAIPEGIAIWKCEVTRLRPHRHDWTVLFTTEDLAWEYAAQQVRQEWGSGSVFGWVKDAFDCFDRGEFKKGVEEHWRSSEMFIQVRKDTVHARVGKPCIVTVNGEKRRLHTDVVTYEDVVLLTHPDLDEAAPWPAYNVTYVDAVNPKAEGVMCLGGPRVQAKDGTRFTCTDPKAV